MLLQITKYQTNARADKGSDSLSRLKQFYLDHGCKYYEVIEDTYEDNSILEIIRFDNPETAGEVQKIDTPEKKELYDNFYRDNHIVEKSEEVRFT